MNNSQNRTSFSTIEGVARPHQSLHFLSGKVSRAPWRDAWYAGKAESTGPGKRFRRWKRGMDMDGWYTYPSIHPFIQPHPATHPSMHSFIRSWIFLNIHLVRTKSIDKYRFMINLQYVNPIPIMAPPKWTYPIGVVTLVIGPFLLARISPRSEWWLLPLWCA